MVEQHGWSFPSPKGFLPSNAEWHTSQALLKHNDQAVKDKTLRRAANGSQAANKHVPCFLLDSRKGDFALRLVTCTLAGIL